MTLDDGRARLATVELERFVRSIRAYDEVEVQRPILDRLLIRPGNPAFVYGTRPRAVPARGTLLFWTLESRLADEPGVVFRSLTHHVFFVAHELGHLLQATLAPEAWSRFRELHAASTPGVHDAPDATERGDHVSAYSERSPDEDFAELFSQLTYARAGWLYGQDLRAICGERPLLAQKLWLVVDAIDRAGGTADKRPGFPLVVRHEAPEDPHGMILEPVWLSLARDDAGTPVALHLPPRLTEAGQPLALHRGAPGEACRVQVLD
ncbi:MAG: hypothetical protein ACFCGT_22785 [Sandaracinaceae bacterium]